ncbi:hypothetical protein DFJ74DRAFT_709446 [Hyaloraphidium curvatum]|nr:hypothetical protein DFJ74DRAFT_709446 [Hyaloraphidium curvatum]
MDDEDHYETLGVPYDASVKDIGRAYRILALKCHPDKVGPDDTAAADLFLRLTKAYDVLSDPERKQNYDALLKAKLAKKQKMAKLDSARRKMTSDLEEREYVAREKRYTDAMEAARQKAEIERLREEGLRRIAKKEEDAARAMKERSNRDLLAGFLAANDNDPPGTTDIDRTLKLRWRPLEPGQEEISEASMRYLLSSFGLIAHLLVSLPKAADADSKKKKKGKASAIVQFAELGFAVDALDSFERREPQWPEGLEVEWALGAEPATVSLLRQKRNNKDASPEADANGAKDYTIRTTDEPFSSFPAISSFGASAPGAELSAEDYEAATLRRMRERAEAKEQERKRILEEEELDESGPGTESPRSGLQPEMKRTKVDAEV